MSLIRGISLFLIVPEVTKGAIQPVRDFENKKPVHAGTYFCHRE